MKTFTIFKNVSNEVILVVLFNFNFFFFFSDYEGNANVFMIIVGQTQKVRLQIALNNKCILLL